MTGLDPDGFDPSVPSVARMYDFALGGKDNFAADREAAQKIRLAAPDAFDVAFDNRRFLKRAVRWAVRNKILQFIDIGSGLPTTENTHQVAQELDETARVAYVDNDPMVVIHAKTILAKRPYGVVAVHGDLREPQKILEDPALRKCIYFGSPVAVVLVAVLHFLDDAEAYKVVECVKQEMPKGSCLIISHATAEDATEHERGVIGREYDQAGAPLTMRTLDQVQRFFAGLELAGPGVADINEWPDKQRVDKPRTACYGGVGIKA